MNLQDRLFAALEARGACKIVSRTSKYITMQMPGECPGPFAFLGRNGSLRFGRNASSSRPASDRYKEMLLSTIPADSRPIPSMASF